MKYGAERTDPAIARSRQIRVLIALEDLAFRLRLKSVLHGRGYEVAEVREGERPQDTVRRCVFDLVVLGVKRRGIAEAIEACKRLRELSPRSGLVLVSGREFEEDPAGADDRADDRADGLEAGADDYITASVDSREFQARIHAVLRRTRLTGTSKRFVTVGDLEIDLEHRSVHQNGRPLHLTRTEFDLLALIVQKPGTPFTHVQLLRSVWGSDYGNELEYLRAYVRLLRRKIDVDASKPSYIRTVPGVGYCFRDPIDP